MKVFIASISIESVSFTLPEYLTYIPDMINRMLYWHFYYTEHCFFYSNAITCTLKGPMCKIKECLLVGIEYHFSLVYNNVYNEYKNRCISVVSK